MRPESFLLTLAFSYWQLIRHPLIGCSTMYHGKRLAFH
jgi:hypothetical protein